MCVYNTYNSILHSFLYFVSNDKWLSQGTPGASPRSTFRSQFSPSATWVLRIELRLAGLVASVLTPSHLAGLRKVS